MTDYVPPPSPEEAANDPRITVEGEPETEPQVVPDPTGHGDDEDEDEGEDEEPTDVRSTDPR